MMLRKAFRNDRKFCFNDDKEATQEWRGGRNVAEVNVRNMRLLPACVQKFESVKILRGRVGSLLKKKEGGFRYKEDCGSVRWRKAVDV
jgi:hypothetical protein